MQMRFVAAFLLGTAACLLLQTTVRAGDKKPDEKKATKAAKALDVTVDGELANTDDKDKKRTDSYCKTYKHKFVEGKTYQIDMKSTDFDSYLRLEDSDGTEVAFDDDGGGFPDARIIYQAAKTGDYTIVCTTYGANSTGKFALTVKQQGVNKDAKPIELEPNKEKVAEHQGELTGDDSPYKTKKIHKLFLCPMEKGTTYRIDLSSQAFDAYLYLEDPDGKLLDQNDDNGESLDSRIVYKAEKTGKYRIVATSLGGTSNGKFTLTVRPSTEEEAKLSALQKKLNNLFDPKSQQEIVMEVTKYLEGKGTKVNNADLGLAMNVGQLLEFAKNEKAAAAALKQFAPFFLKAEDAKVMQAAKRLEGVSRRLNLLGNEMEIKGKLLDGKDFDLKNLKGKVVLVDFWATWCGPCIGEIPNMKKMHEKYNKQGFEVIGISLDFSEDALKKFIAKEDLPWSSIYDGARPKGDGLADHYGINAIPFAVLVGRDGRVVSTHARGADLTRLLDEMFAEKKSEK